MKDCLIKWSAREKESPDEPTRFITTLRHIKDVYKYLQENLPPKQLQDLLHDHSAIFYPCSPEAASNPECLVEGKFVGTLIRSSLSKIKVVKKLAGDKSV